MSDPAFQEAVAILAARFARQLVQALQTATVAEIEAVARGGHVSHAAAAPDLPAKRGPGRPKGAKTGSGTKPKTKAGRTALSIVAHVKEHPGENAETIRKGVGLPRGRWNLAIAYAMDNRLLRREGEKRATRYWPV